MAKKLSRNAPCHCGSWVKYKKCCLPIEEAARAEALERKREREKHFIVVIREWEWEEWEEEEEEEDQSWHARNNLEAENQSYWTDFFVEFVNADLDRKLAMAINAVDEAPGFDDEWVFELTRALAVDLRSAGRAAEHDALIDRMVDKHPEAAEQESVWLDSLRLTNALQRPDGDARPPALRLAAVAVDEFSTFRDGIAALMYHGRVKDALAACDAAWPQLRDTDEVVDVVVRELQGACIWLTLDLFLQEADTWEPSQFAPHIEKYRREGEESPPPWWDEIGEQRWPSSRRIISKEEASATMSGSEQKRLAEGILI